MAIRRLRIECWIPKATATHSEYVMLVNSISDYANAPHYYVCTNISCFVECETWWFKLLGKQSGPLGCDAVLFGRQWHSRCTSVCRGADKSLARPTSGCILFDGENILFDVSLVAYIKVNVSRDRPRWPKGFRVG